MALMLYLRQPGKWMSWMEHMHMRELNDENDIFQLLTVPEVRPSGSVTAKLVTVRFGDCTVRMQVSILRRRRSSFCHLLVVPAFPERRFVLVLPSTISGF